MNRPHALGINLDMVRHSREDPDAAFACALHPIERTVNLDDPFRIKSGALKLAVDIGCENESTVPMTTGPTGRIENPSWGVVCR